LRSSAATSGTDPTFCKNRVKEEGKFLLPYINHQRFP
jgi:hypothetical protein